MLISKIKRFKNIANHIIVMLSTTLRMKQYFSNIKDTDTIILVGSTGVSAFGELTLEFP